MTILCIDGMNFLHRSRSGMNFGSAPVIFNFMRNFRSLVSQFNPNRIYFVLEGKSEKRKSLMPEYKANRIIDPGTKKYEEAQKFYEQTNEIVSILTKAFPVTVIRHPKYECDDTIYNLIKRSSNAVDWIVVSNDSDFIQLLDEFKHVKLYNPMSKEFIENPDYDYVTWKSLRGDGSDNIAGIPGIGDKTALNIVNNPDLLEKTLQNSENAKIFTRNYELIKFITWSDDDALEMASSAPIKNWDLVRGVFEKHQFNSLLKDSTWQKFINTFDHMFGDQ